VKLEIAKSAMLCTSCGVGIEAGEYFALGPTCFRCVQQPRKPAPELVTQRDGPTLFDDPQREFYEAAKDELGAKVLNFKGATYNAARDKHRLTSQALRIFRFMRESGYVSLKEIETATGDPQASISARIRSFKAAGHDYDKRLRAGSDGTWEYKLFVNSSISLEIVEDDRNRTNAA
jgi:hypothetical protein